MDPSYRKLFIESNGENYFTLLIDDDKSIRYIRRDVMCGDLCKVITSMLDYFDTEYQIRINFFHTNFVNPVDPKKYEDSIKQKLVEEIPFKYIYKYVEIVRWDWCWCRNDNEGEWMDNLSNIISETIKDYIATV
jgi:hypothetical protein